MEKARLYMLKNPEHAQWALLLDSLCVVDADSDDAVAKIEALQDPDIVHALSVCPIQNTSKGRHYVFIRPEWADAEGYWDGARQVKGFDADLKTRCSTGTRGVLAVCPSLNKTWVREPWAEGTKLVDIPRTLMEVVAKPRQKKTTSLKVVGKDDIDTESAPPKLFDEVAELVDILAASRASSYRTWMEVGWCLHNISPSHLPLWEIFSKKCPEKYTNGRCGEVWGTMNSEDCAGFRLGSLHMWARHDSPVKYWDIVSRHVIEDVRACNGSHNEIARVANKIIGNRIVAASTNGKLWYIFDRRWVTDIAAIRVKHELSTVVREHFIIALHKERASQSAYNMQSNESTKNENADRLAHITARLQDANFKNNVMQEMLEYFYDPDFMKKIDADPNLIGFNNEMTAKGCFSYKNATVNGFNITNQLQVRVEAIDNNVAKIYTTDENGNPLPMPVNVSLRTGEDVNVPVYNNEFLICGLKATCWLSVASTSCGSTTRSSRPSLLATASRLSHCKAWCIQCHAAVKRGVCHAAVK
eukprot:gene8386-biopygen12417